MDKTLPAVGIDVSKLTLDVRVDSQGQPRRLAQRLTNGPQGFAQLQSWFHAQGLPRVHDCLEATSTYSDAISGFMFERGHQVSVVNPARVAAFRTSDGIRTIENHTEVLVNASSCTLYHPAL